VTFSGRHQAWYEGDARWYKAVGAGSTWHIQWYDGILTDSISNLVGRDFKNTYLTWEEANEAAGRTATHWFENASEEGCAKRT
jgi:hypothetical protein